MKLSYRLFKELKEKIQEIVGNTLLTNQILALIQPMSEEEIERTLREYLPHSVGDYIPALVKAFSGKVEVEKPKQFPISACCNASVNISCQACGQPCQLAEWNKEPKPDYCWDGKSKQERIEKLEKLPFEQCKSWKDWAEKIRIRIVTIEHKLNELIKAYNQGA